MIPEQLDLFGGPPRPPKKIWEEEAEVTPQAEQAQPPVDEKADVPEDDLPPFVTEGLGEVEPEAMVPTETEIVEEPADAAEPIIAQIETDEVAAEEPEFSEPEPEPEAEEPAIFFEAPPSKPISDVIAWVEPEEPLNDEEAAAAEAEAVQFAPVSEVEFAAPRIKVEPLADDILVVSVNPSPSELAAATSDIENGGIDGMNIPPDEILFQRQYYTMRETAGMFGISHSMLRYWENEFEVLQPRKNRKGDRYFRPIDIKNLQLIYHLLKVRKFTLDGAKEYLRNHNKALDTFELIQRLEKVKSFLHEIKAHL